MSRHCLTVALLLLPVAACHTAPSPDAEPAMKPPASDTAGTPVGTFFTYGDFEGRIPVDRPTLVLFAPRRPATPWEGRVGNLESEAFAHLRAVFDSLRSLADSVGVVLRIHDATYSLLSRPWLDVRLPQPSPGATGYLLVAPDQPLMLVTEAPTAGRMQELLHAWAERMASVKRARAT